jgi:hypothetical protein
MRTAEAFAVGETRREASAPGTRGVGRARTTRLASVAIVTTRVPQEKTTQTSDKLFAVAQRRDRRRRAQAVATF